MQGSTVQIQTQVQLINYQEISLEDRRGTERRRELLELGLAGQTQVQALGSIWLQGAAREPEKYSVEAGCLWRDAI